MSSTPLEITLSPNAYQIFNDANGDGDLFSCADPINPEATLATKAVEQNVQCKVTLPETGDLTWTNDSKKWSATMRFVTTASDYMAKTVAGKTQKNGKPLSESPKIKALTEALIATKNEGLKKTNLLFLTDNAITEFRTLDPNGDYVVLTYPVIKDKNGNLAFELLAISDDKKKAPAYQKFAYALCKRLDHLKQTTNKPLPTKHQAIYDLLKPHAEYVSNLDLLQPKKYNSETLVIHTGQELEDALKKLQPGDRALVTFSANWCGPCQDYAPYFDKLARAYDGRLLMIRLEGKNESENEWGPEYGIREFPTIAFVDTNKQVTQVTNQYNPLLDLDKAPAPTPNEAKHFLERLKNKASSTFDKKVAIARLSKDDENNSSKIEVAKTLIGLLGDPSLQSDAAITLTILKTPAAEIVPALTKFIINNRDGMSQLPETGWFNPRAATDWAKKALSSEIFSDRLAGAFILISDRNTSDFAPIFKALTLPNQFTTLKKYELDWFSEFVKVLITNSEVPAAMKIGYLESLYNHSAEKTYRAYVTELIANAISVLVEWDRSSPESRRAYALLAKIIPGFDKFRKNLDSILKSFVKSETPLADYLDILNYLTIYLLTCAPEDTKNQQKVIDAVIASLINRNDLQTLDSAQLVKRVYCPLEIIYQSNENYFRQAWTANRSRLNTSSSQAINFFIERGLLGSRGNITLPGDQLPPDVKIGDKPEVDIEKYAKFVTIDNSEYQGTIDATIIKKEIMPLFYIMAQELYRKNHNFSGKKIIVQLTIETDGSISDATINGFGSLPNTISQLKAKKLPPQTQQTVVRIPIVFGPLTNDKKEEDADL